MDPSKLADSTQSQPARSRLSAVLACQQSTTRSVSLLGVDSTQYQPARSRLHAVLACQESTPRSVSLLGVDSTQCQPTLDYRIFFEKSTCFFIKKSLTQHSVSLRGVTYLGISPQNRISKRHYFNLYCMLGAQMGWINEIKKCQKSGDTATLSNYSIFN